MSSSSFSLPLSLSLSPSLSLFLSPSLSLSLSLESRERKKFCTVSAMTTIKVFVPKTPFISQVSPISISIFDCLFCVYQNTYRLRFELRESAQSLVGEKKMKLDFQERKTFNTYFLFHFPSMASFLFLPICNEIFLKNLHSEREREREKMRKRRKIRARK